MIKDDPEIGKIDDYEGPGVFVSLAIIIGAVILIFKLGRMVFA